ncbi:MAG: hypothetical protein AABY22_07855 [Nanoarchaeota archaeon]
MKNNKAETPDQLKCLEEWLGKTIERTKKVIFNVQKQNPFKRKRTLTYWDGYLTALEHVKTGWKLNK